MVDEEELDEEDDDNDDYEGLTPALYFVDDVFVKIANKEKQKGKQSLTAEQSALLTVWCQILRYHAGGTIIDESGMWFNPVAAGSSPSSRGALRFNGEMTRKP